MPKPAPYKALLKQVQKALSPELRNAAWTSKIEEGAHPLFGLCYVASEALYHLLGGKDAGWTPQILTHESWPAGLAEGESHWFLRHESGEIADPTAEQFKDKPIPYEAARGIGFMTRQPSRRSQVVIERAEAGQGQQQAASR